MRKVKLHFTLVGKSSEWKRNLLKDVKPEWTNADTFKSVVDTVVDYFGGRALIVMNENTLKNDAVPYPEFYSAGWFISEDDEKLSELVVVSHGDSMAEANKSVVESVKSLDWDALSATV